MSDGTCPKCGRNTAVGAVICGGCDFILDASFLGDDITDAQSESRPGVGGNGPVRSDTEAIMAAPGPSGPSVEVSLEAGMSIPSEYGDALILGDLDDELASFEGADTGFAQAEVTHARIYVGGATQAVLNPLAVPIIDAGVNQSLKFTPYEKHVLEFVDGAKNVAGIQKAAGLQDADFYTTMALLSDKGFIRIRTGMSLADAAVEEEDPLFEDDDDPTATMVAEGPPASLLLDDDDSVEDGGVFASSAEDSMTENAVLDGPLAFADSLASQERDFVDESDPAPSATRRRSRRKKRRPPPLPTGSPPASVDQAADVVEMTTGDVFATASSVHDLPTDLGDAESEVGSDVSSEEDGPDVMSLPTQPPSGPVVGLDISLASIEAPVLDAVADDEWVMPLPGGQEDVSWGPTADVRAEEDPEGTLEIDEEEALPPPVQPTAPVARPTAPTALKVSPAEELEVAEDDEEEAPPPLSFEMRRKADKLFENAQKDMAAGRLSSAIMNAKLALHYNPNDQACVAALADWQSIPEQRSVAPDRERILVEAAQDAEARGQYKEAIEMLDEALLLSPRVAAIHNLKGVILATRLKRYREASGCLMRAVDLAPGNATYKNNLGKVVVKEELAGSREGGAAGKKKKKKKKKKDDENHIVIKKLRPKFF